MIAVVLVGGEGTRLRPLTLDTPKQMLPVAEEPMIERVLAQLARHGVRRAVLSLGYRPDAFVAAYPEGKAAGVELFYAVEPEPLGTAGALRFAAKRAGIAERLFVLNGDVLSDLDLGALASFHDKLGAAATIALTPVEDPSAFGVVVTDEEGWVRAFVEKPPRDAAPSRLVNAGAYVLEPEVLEHIPEGRAVSIERETFPRLVAEGVLAALGFDAYWIDTGTPAALLAASLDFASGVRGLPPARGARAVRDGVYVIGHAELRGELVAPVLVGEGAVVHAGAVVRRSVVGRGAVVGPGASVLGSVVFPDARVGAGARVEDSIVGRRATVGERAVLRGLSVLGTGAVVADESLLTGARVPPVGEPSLGERP